MKPKNDILKIILKHNIYEMCIDIMFRKILQNFPRDIIQHIPSPGEKFVTIQDNYLDICYHNCTIMKVTDLEIWKDFSYDEKKDVILAFEFKRSECDGEDDETNEMQYFTRNEYPFLIFKK